MKGKKKKKWKNWTFPKGLTYDIVKKIWVFLILFFAKLAKRYSLGIFAIENRYFQTIKISISICFSLILSFIAIYRAMKINIYILNKTWKTVCMRNKKLGSARWLTCMPSRANFYPQHFGSPSRAFQTWLNFPTLYAVLLFCLFYRMQHFFFRVSVNLSVLFLVECHSTNCFMRHSCNNSWGCFPYC